MRVLSLTISCAFLMLMGPEYTWGSKGGHFPSELSCLFSSHPTKVLTVLLLFPSSIMSVFSFPSLMK